MKKRLLLFIFLGNLVLGQKKLELTYSVSSVNHHSESVSPVNPMIAPYISRMEKELEEISFSLQINGKESLWFLNNRDSYSQAHMGKALAGTYTYYHDAKTSDYIVQRDFFGHLFLVTEKTAQSNWIRTQESKIILGYECFKATATVTQKVENQDKTFLTEAWYCPQLKYEVGPQNFGGLEGIILELTDKGRKYYCTEILEGSKTRLFVIEKPKIGKPVSVDEFYNETNRIAEDLGIPHD